MDLDQKEQVNSRILSCFKRFIKCFPEKTNGSDSVSGAYLFLPDKQATVLSPHIDELIIVKGPMQSFVYLHLKANYSLFQRVSLNQHEDAIRINNLIDLKKHEENIEFGMQLNADPKFNQFYTDLNGLEVSRL
jgi:alpha-mannosidase II